MRDLGRARALVGGAVGEPGSRTFYLQVDVEAGRHWFLLEKQQLAMMAERLLGVLKTLGASDGVDPPDLVEPASVSFRVGEIVIGRGEGWFTVSLQPDGNDAHAEAVQFDVGFEAMSGMAQEALRAVAAGRPLCRFCSLPIDPGGHVCPAANGHRGRRLEA